MLCGNGLHARYQFHTCPAIYDIHGVSDVCFSYSHKEWGFRIFVHDNIQKFCGNSHTANIMFRTS